MGAVPNPHDDDAEFEGSHSKHRFAGRRARRLEDRDSTGTRFWTLTSADGVVEPGETVVVSDEGRFAPAGGGVVASPQ